MNDNNNLRMRLKEALDNLWSRVQGIFSGLDDRVTALEQGGGGGGAVSGVKGDEESTYRTGNVNLTAANIGAKATQSAVFDPTASGTGLTFIDSISQDAQGVITPTKKTVQTATQSADGVMSSTDKAKLDGIASGAQVNTITGVKGEEESSYRTGNVNLSRANLGIGYRIYNSVTELGLTAGSATILAAWNAMPVNSVLFDVGGNFANTNNDRPAGSGGAGVVEILKASDSARSYVLFHAKGPTIGDYRMYANTPTAYNGNDYNKPSGIWIKNVDSQQVATIDYNSVNGDLDNVKKNFFGYVEGAANILHVPVTQNGLFICGATIDASRCVQLYVALWYDYLYMRQYTGSSWTAWKKTTFS